MNNAFVNIGFTTCFFPHLLFTMLQDCYCLTVGTVDEIIIDAPWSYDSCPNCTTTFDPSKGGSACRSCQNSVTDTVPQLATIVFCTNYLLTRLIELPNFADTAMDAKV